MSDVMGMRPDAADLLREPIGAWVPQLFGTWGSGQQEEAWVGLAWRALGVCGLLAEKVNWDEYPRNTAVLLALASLNERFQDIIGGGFGEHLDIPVPDLAGVPLSPTAIAYWAGMHGLAVDAVEDGSTREGLMSLALQEEAAARIPDVAAALADAWGFAELFSSLRWASVPDPLDGDLTSWHEAYVRCLVEPHVDDHRARNWLDQCSVYPGVARHAQGVCGSVEVPAPRDALLALEVTEGEGGQS